MAKTKKKEKQQQRDTSEKCEENLKFQKRIN